MYQQGIDRLDYWLSQQYKNAAARSRLSFSLSVREAELTLDPKVAQRPNAETRKAQLILALRDDTNYQGLQRSMELAQEAEEVAKAQVAVFRERMRYLRAGLDMYKEV